MKYIKLNKLKTIQKFIINLSEAIGRRAIEKNSKSSKKSKRKKSDHEGKKIQTRTN